MTLFQKKLKRWEEAGLISAEQAEKIAAFEAESKSAARWLVWSIAAVGALAIASGLSALVAANWDDIPDALKLAVGMVLLVGLALTAMKVEGRAENWPRDVLLLLHQLLVLGNIGLVAQVFHLSGAPWRPFAVAAVIGIPAALVATRSIHTDVVLGFGIISLFFWLDQHEILRELMRGSWPLIPLSGALGFTLLAARWLLVRWNDPVQAASLRHFGGVLVLVAAIAQTVRWNEDRPDEALPLFAIIPLIASLALAAWMRFRMRADWTVVALGLLSLLLLAGPELAGPRPVEALRIVGFVLSAGWLVALAFFAADAGSRWGVNFATLMLAGRLLWLFFELFEDLFDTGLGLILAGVVLLGVSYGWWRFRAVIRRGVA